MSRKPFRFLLIAAVAATLFAQTGAPPAQAARPAETTDVPVPIVTDQVEYWAAGNGLVYWAANCFADEFNPFASLKRVPSSGGTQRTLESINDYNKCITYLNLLSASDGLYYFDDSEGRIERMPLSAPFTAVEVKVLVGDDQPSAARMVESAGYLYWAGFQKILRTLKDGSGPVDVVANTASAPSDLLVTGNTVYWTDSAGVHLTNITCGTLPCTPSTFATFGASTRGHGLVYRFIGGIQGNYQVFWVERTTAGANNTYAIRYRSCNQLVVCTLNPPATFYTATTNWLIGSPLLVNGNLYWTERDISTVSNSTGDVKRRAVTASTPGADTIATGQANIKNELYAVNDLLFFARQSTGIYSLSLAASAITRDFVLDSFEVTQAIQNTANQAPLVAGKTTYVRAYGRQISGPSTPNVEARLYGTRNGNPLPGSPLAAVNLVRALNTGGSFDRSRLNDGWYFQLPDSWISAGATSLRVVIDPRSIHTDPNTANNELTVAVSFQSQPPVCVVTLPVRTHNPLVSTNSPNFGTMVSQFKRRWPVADAWIFRDGGVVEELQVCFYGPFPYPCFGPYELDEGWGLTNGPPDRDKVIISLWTRAQLTFNPDVCDDAGAPTHFMGMVHPDAATANVAGYASTVSNQSWVKIPQPAPIPPGWNSMQEGSTMAQELAHNYGRKHVNCGGPDDIDSSYPYPPCQIANVGATSYYGFDTTTRQPIRPTEAADFMSYANNTWVSDYTYRALMNSFAAAATASAPEALGPSRQAVSAGENVVVTGLVDTANARGDIASAVIAPAGSLPPATLARAALIGSGIAPHTHDHAGTQSTAHAHAVHKLRLSNAAGTVLLERTLTLTPLDDHSPDSAGALFAEVFPPPAGVVAKIELLADSTVLDTLTPGAAAPVAAVSQPAAGATVDDVLTVAWTASDPDPNDRLLFTIQYSYNNGAHWHTLIDNQPSLPTGQYTLAIDALSSLHSSAPNQALVRVLASDGYNTAVATSQPFTLLNRRPSINIVAPLPAQGFPAGQTIALQASAVDAEDGGLSGNAVSWTIDGAPLASGSDALAPGLASGTHIATVTVTDTAGLTATAQAVFEVTPLSIPEIATPTLNGFCDDAGYSDAAQWELAPYGDGAQGSVRVGRTGTDIWACFSGLAKGATTPGAFAGLRIDANNSRDALAQTSDFGFFVGEDGSVSSTRGDGAGNFGTAGPGGVDGQVAAGSTTWSAELKISASVIGGMDHLISLRSGHYWVNFQGNDYVWPYASTYNEPNTWSTAALGAQPFVSNIAPFTATLRSSFTLTVEGSGFISGTTVLWNGAALQTTFVDSEHLTAVVGSTQTGSPGAAQIGARAPAPGNFTSNALTLTVVARQVYLPLVRK